jgi:hypothetical protein
MSTRDEAFAQAVDVAKRAMKTHRYDPLALRCACGWRNDTNAYGGWADHQVESALSALLDARRTTPCTECGNWVVSSCPSCSGSGSVDAGPLVLLAPGLFGGGFVDRRGQAHFTRSTNLGIEKLGWQPVYIAREDET